MFLPLPFSSKDLPDGKKLFRRKHGYVHTLSEGGSSVLLIAAPYGVQKINEAEIVNSPELLRCDFKILDSVSGLYSSIPNRLLNQFGFGIVVSKDFFQDISAYDAELLVGMQIEITFYNPGPSRDIGINIVFHEVL